MGNSPEWQIAAVSALDKSLYPVPQELNGVDWKCALSDNSERLAQHLCAFSNTLGGGYLVFGLNDDATFRSLSQSEIEQITHRLVNIAYNSLAWPVQLEHSVVDYQGNTILLFRIPEQPNKPIYLRGGDIYDSYIRSAGHTFKASRNQVHALLASSYDLPFERRVAKRVKSGDEVEALLDYQSLYRLLDRKIPSEQQFRIKLLLDYNLINSSNDGYDISNMGAILFARKLADFPLLVGKEIVVRKYQGTNNRVLSTEYRSQSGYAIEFEKLVGFVSANTSVEQIEIHRKAVSDYPAVAIREFLANMMVHQDFGVRGMPITIELFSNRLSFTNPGYCLNDVNRLIDLPPHSRNEILAQMMLQLDLCERRGSGIDRAAEAIAQMRLPAYKVQSGDDYTRVTMYPKKNISEMTRDERVAICYQFACLQYEDGNSINNESLRDRFSLNKNQSALASRILSDTLSSRLIKVENPEMESRRYKSYIPFYG